MTLALAMPHCLICKTYRTAEQVETVAQYKTLKLLGCDTVQGFLFSKPVPIIDAQSLLNAEVIISR